MREMVLLAINAAMAQRAFDGTEPSLSKTLEGRPPLCPLVFADLPRNGKEGFQTISPFPYPFLTLFLTPPHRQLGVAPSGRPTKRRGVSFVRVLSTSTYLSTYLLTVERVFSKLSLARCALASYA
jgi:hypothetical protein